MHMREELAESIQDFMGGVIIVSHDKFLLQSVVDEFYLIKDKHLEHFSGDLEDYHKVLLLEASQLTKAAKADKINKGNKVAVRNVLKVRSEIEKVEELMKKTNAKIEAIDISSSPTDDMTNEHNKHQQKIVELEAKWLALQSELEISSGV
jgi:ATP-binding cassette subfamily F protein 3